MEYIILIPAYEPDDKLLDLVKNINNKYKVIVVDDGSVNKEIFNDNNMGKGYALKVGFEYIKANYKDFIVVCMDADGQHTIEDAVRLCNYVKDNLDTLAIGRRYWDKTTPITNRTGNAITRHVFKKKTGLSIYDTQSGLRAFSYKLIDYMLSIPGNRYEYEMNVLLNLKKNNISFHEIDIKTIYFEKKSSHFRNIVDSYKIYRDIYKFKG